MDWTFLMHMWRLWPMDARLRGHLRGEGCVLFQRPDPMPQIPMIPAKAGIHGRDFPHAHVALMVHGCPPARASAG